MNRRRYERFDHSGSVMATHSVFMCYSEVDFQFKTEYLNIFVYFCNEV